MPSRKNPPPYASGPNHNKKNNNNNKNEKKNNASGRNASVERIIANESLLATESEKHATSKSLYGDPGARISGNVHNIYDRIRMRAYQSILKNIKGKSLLHLGCGMGLISMIAARSLASVVVAVDHSAIVDAAQVVAKQNGLQNISFFHGSLRDVMPQFPLQKFDVILCEWMGAFLVNDSLLDDALFARDNLLAEGGVMCPDGSSIHVVGVSDYAFHLDTVEYWSNVYGFKMEPMKALVRQEVETCSVPAANIATSTCLAHTVNIATLKKSIESDMNGTGSSSNNNNNNNGGEVEGETAKKMSGQDLNDYTVPFSMRASRDTTVNYLTFFVDATFTNPNDPGANFVLGIRPGGSNLWTETSVGLPEPLPLRAGETLSGELRVRVVDRRRGAAAVDITARTDGGVAKVETSGSYVYQHC
ncbi:putative arginine N-methyltransferase [Trypanosoma theileri]|uniref:Putative arginine N-methyltransferase n=1 Tax=Trypanosoma theileri TaxID=67003 RepID=A0A1X0PA69_9TRYP|nr:putative arginine N-methyltransferase [Trypanosoma theileri]ORC93350.1 putative arginine N-methyltransferase [Trypanosoma theileri]